MADNHSQSGSSKGGSTTGSQAASNAGTIKGVAAVLQRAVVFPIITQAELAVDWKLSLAGLLVELLQWTGLVFNKNFAWGPVFGNYVSQVVYFFNMPLFDSKWAENTKEAALVFFWGSLVLHVALLAGVVIGLGAEHQQYSLGPRWFARLVTHGYASFLFLPTVLIFSSFFVCDSSRTNLYWYPSDSCNGVFAGVHFAGGVLGLLLLSTFAYVTTSMLFDDSPSSMLIMSRPQSDVTEWTLFLKLLAGVAYHVLLSKGLTLPFSASLAAFAIVHAAQYVFYLPFYRMQVTRYRTTVFLFVATFAIVASVNQHDRESSTSTIVVLIVATAAAIVGWFLPSLRLNRNYVSAASALRRGTLMNHSSRDAPTYPLGLPRNDLSFSPHRNIEELFHANRGQTESEMREDEDDSITITEPYLSRVYCPSDVECCTRFLNEHYDHCGSPPTDAMRFFAARLFIKGLARYRRDPLVIYHFCQFLTVFGRKNRLAITEVEQVNKNDASFALSYRAFRLTLRLKSSLNMSDTTHLKLLNSSLRLHKEILGHMTTFWSKLLSANVDTVQLAAIANTITTRREQALELFRRVLLNPNQNILLKYARFLEQVMLDTAMSKVITDRVAEQAEAKRQEMMAGNNRGRQSETDTQQNENADLMAKIDEALRGGADTAESAAGGSSTIERLSTLLHVMFLVVVLLCGGFFLYEALRVGDFEKHRKQVQAASRCRSLVTMGGYFVGEIQNELAQTIPNVMKLSSWRSQLLSVQQEFYEKHSSLTQGDLVSSYGSVESFLKTARTEVLLPDTSGLSLSGSFSRSLTDLFNLGFLIASNFLNIASYTANTTTPVQTYMMSFIVLNANDQFSTAYNRSLNYYQLENASAMETYFWVATGLFAATMVMFFVIYSTMVLNFQKIGASKLSTLNLFTLIPRLYLEQLHVTSKEKLELFDVDDQHDQSENLDPSRQELTLGVRGRTDGADANNNNNNGKNGKAMTKRGSDVAARGRSVSISVEQPKKEKVPHNAAGGGENGAEGALSGNEDEAEQNEFEDDTAEEDARKQQEARNQPQMSAALKLLLFALLLTALLAVVFAFSIASFAVVYKMQALTVEIAGERDTALYVQDLHHQYYSVATELSDTARLFVENGNVNLLTRYYELIRDENLNLNGLHRAMVFEEDDATNLNALVQIQTLMDDLVTRQHVAMWLAASARGVPAMQSYLLERIYASNRAYNFTQLQATLTSVFSTFFITPSPSPASDQTQDAALSSAAKLLTARSLVFDDIYDAHFPLIERYRSRWVNTAVNRLEGKEDDRSVHLRAAIALYVVSILFFLVLVRVYFAIGSGAQSTGMTQSGSLPRVGLVVGIIVCIANVIVLSILLARHSTSHSTFTDHMQFRVAANQSLGTLHAQVAFARSYAQFGWKDKYHLYVDEHNLGLWETSLSALLHTFVRTQSSVTSSSTRAMASQLIQLRQQGEELFSFSEASMLLTTAGYNYSNVNNEFGFLQDVVYNRAREPDYREDVARFGIDELTIYTNKTFDLAASSLTQIQDLSRATMSGSRFMYHASAAFNQIGNLIRSMDRKVQEHFDLNRSSFVELSYVALILSVIGLLLMVLLGMYAVFATVNDLDTDNSKSTSANGAIEREQLFDDLTSESRFSLLGLAVLVCAVYGLDIYNSQTATTAMRQLNLASQREWLVARSMVATQKIWYDTPLGGTNVASPLSGALLTTLRDLDHQRSEFYVGSIQDTMSGFSVIGRFPQADEAMFGSSHYSSSQFAFDCAAALATSAVTAADLNVVNPPSSLIDGVFNEGVEPVVLQWLMLLIRLSDASTITAALSYKQIVSNLVVPLTTRLNLASNQYHEDMKNEFGMLSSAHYGLVAALAVVAIMLLMLVFRPMISLLLNEEHGTKLLLRMIPPSVRQNVPAISEYLETGSITQNEKLQKINEVCTEMSVVSLFVIDWNGTILRVSPAAREEFGYDGDEMLGQNIKIIMPDSIAQHHDEYLHRYRSTGVAKVIDRASRLTAKRKDGTQFPVELMVREFRKNATESTFLGFARNVSDEVEYEKVNKLNEAVSDMSTVPVLVIDMYGTIRRANRAAMKTFMYTSQELLGKNIKLLMPTRIGMNHDGYLEAYQRTKKKFVIDNSRKVVGLRKNGEEFPVEITVREMTNERGKTQFFIGYAKDITGDLLFTQSVMANEAVIQISPTPVISINPVGTILIFSPAAESSWGYKAEEILGKNVRLLMNEDDAMRHDGYLARYMKTGEKHIVDNTRVVKARRKDGRAFTVEANIKELRKGDHVTFIGYLRDLTKEYEIAYRNKVNKTVFAASPFPIVVIDEIGTVLHFNPMAEKQLMYRADQVINQNVKMLMPDVVAEQHDNYLARYRETGIKTIIDAKRRVHAKKADGRQLAVEISVKEVLVDDLLSDNGRKRLFVGYIRDITEEFQMTKANILNDAITNLCTIPMISINRFGSILTFSLASERQFGYKQDEVIGKNIKMLMPKRIADNHDEYLRKYGETGIKHVIDTTRDAFALTKDGVEIPVEIAVREIRKPGLDTIFVGYVRDVKNEVETDDARLLVDATINVSPVPIIVINVKGIVQKFSTEAQNVFGWRADEIVGKNIKMLMQQEIARNHDSYLKAYLKTGVKSVIDGVRAVQAVRKDGLQLSVEIMVRELKKESATSSHDSLFVGYLRDMSQEYILRQSNELKDVILNQSSIPMIQADVRGKILFVNPALLEEFQYEENELRGANVKVLTPPEVSRVHDQYLSRYLETRKKYVIDSVREVVAMRKDGSRFPVTISLRELVADGQTTYFGYLRNMTQNMMVRDQKALGDVIIDLSMIPLIIIDDIGTILAFNRAASEAFRYTQDEMLGQNVKILQTPEVANVHDQYLSNYKKYRVKSVIDTTRRVLGKKKNGYVFPMEITVKEMHDPVMQRSTYVGYLRNITDEYRLNLANEIADAVANMSPIPLVAITAAGTITKFSRAAEEEFGYTSDEMIGQNVKILQPIEVAQNHDMYLERYMSTGIKRVVDTTRQVRAQKRNGDQFPCEITVREVRVEGSERSFVGFIRNLSQQHADEASAKTNSKIMDLMTTPLIVISDIGTIEEANPAAADTFGYKQEALIGGNIKMLMPQSIAENHDEYLANYLKTGKKHVLDQKRVVTALHSDGTEFPIEVNVRENIVKELNKRTYFGFLRDLRQDLQLKYAFHLNESITEMTNTPIIAIDTAGVVIKFSRAAAMVFGYDPQEVLGNNVSMLMPESYAVNHDSYLANYLVTRKKTVVDSIRRVPGKRKNGTTFQAELRVCEYTKSGGFTTYVAFFKDVTDDDRNSQDRLVSEAVAAMSNLAVIVADKRGVIGQVNDSSCELFRYSREEMIGQNVKMLMPRQYAMHHDNYLEAYQRTKVKHVIDTTRRAQALKKGDISFDMEIGVRELELDGVGTRYLGFVRDITTEVALEESSKLSSAIVSLSPVPIVVMDHIGTVMQFSDLAAVQFGYQKDEVLGRNVKMLMPQAIADKHDEYLATYMRTGVKAVVDSSRVATARKKNGTTFSAEISVREIVATDGSKYFTGFIKPV